MKWLSQGDFLRKFENHDPNGGNLPLPDRRVL